MKRDRILGIHHVTAISRDPQENLNFYTGILGLRLVKISVNQDDPTAYHFFYADEQGTPGTDITFFIYPNASKGVTGAGQVKEVSLNIPSESIDYWLQRLQRYGVRFRGPRRTDDGLAIDLEDPDGLNLRLIGRSDIENIAKPWRKGPVPREHAIRGLFGVLISVDSCRHSGWFLEEVLGFRKIYEGPSRHRYVADDGGPSKIIDVECTDTSPGSIGYGSVHHVAWRVKDPETQIMYREKLEKLGFYVTPVIDRKWFRSIYFREPGYVLYEIATDGPGFQIDEPPEELGTKLVLPEWLEDRREAIERSLPKINIPNPENWR